MIKIDNLGGNNFWRMNGKSDIFSHESKIQEKIEILA